MDAPGGAVGAIGATVKTFEHPNKQFNQWLYRVLYDRDQGHLGIVNNWAKLEVLKTYYGTGYWQYAICNHLAYLLLGDPSMWILPGCGSSPVSMKEVLSQIKDLAQGISIQPILTIYPNPVSDILSLDITNTQSGEAELKLYDLSGRLVITQIFSVGDNCCSHSVDLTSIGLNSGVYIIEVSAPGLCESRKIVFAP